MHTTTRILIAAAALLRIAPAITQAQGRRGEPGRLIEALRDRLSRLSRVSLRINESHDLDAVLQSVLAPPAR